MNFSLDVLAIHRLEVGQAARAVPIGTAQRHELAPEAIDRIERYVADLDAREEALGKAVPAWWTGTQPGELQRIEACPVGAFDQASVAVMSRLEAVAPATAASGVMIFARGTRQGGGSALAIFKMALRPVSHTQFNPGAQAAAAITVAQLANVLPEPKDLAKAAIAPHPRGEAPLRVVDVRTGEEPADYWLRFLGAQQPPKQPQLGRLLVDTSRMVLENAGVPHAQAQSIVARELETRLEAGQPLQPRAFMEQLALQANKPPATIWNDAQTQQAALARPHAQISTAAAARLKTSIDLGDEILLTGPASLMRPPRVEIDQDERGWFVKVRTTAQPRPRTK
jgi:hypothetical protein